MRHTHSQRLERWLGAEHVARLSRSMRDWYGPPIAVQGVPGYVHAAKGGDFIGAIEAGDTLAASATSEAAEAPAPAFGLGRVLRPPRRPREIEAAIRQADNVVVAFATVRGRTRAIRDEEWLLRRAA